MSLSYDWQLTASSTTTTATIHPWNNDNVWQKTYPCAVQVVAFSKTYLSRMSIPSEQNKT
jgi:hypothetical protein